MAAAPPSVPSRGFGVAAGWAAPAACAALLALGVGLKLVSGAGGPLWLDEGWTLGIVGRPSWAAFVEQLRLDVNPPLYFLLMRGWTAVAGLSNASLRAPSVVFAALAPFVVLGVRTPLARSDRWVAAAMLGLSPLAIYFAQEARAYALLLLLEAGAAVAFLRLLDRPTTARATLWCALTAAACLTHQHAVTVGGMQGLAYLAVHRARAVRTWPAALALLPWLAWSVPHAPRVLAFARPEFSWYLPLRLADLPALANLLTGGVALLWLALLAGGRLAQGSLAARGVEGRPPSRAALVLGAAALAAVAVVVGMGLLRPSFTPRYLTPAAPGLVIGMVAALRAAAPRGAPAFQLALAALLGVGATGAALAADSGERRAYSIEAVSTDLQRAGVRRLTWLLDNPTDGVLAPAERAALADAFFVRSGAAVEVTGLPYGPVDPNPRLMAATPPGGGLLWLWDVRVPRTAALRFPPRLEALDPGLSCRRYAGGALGVVACVRSPAAWTR